MQTCAFVPRPKPGTSQAYTREAMEAGMNLHELALPWLPGAEKAHACIRHHGKPQFLSPNCHSSPWV
jgi:hypothetical protein